MISSSYTKKLIESHRFQGKSNDCGPFSLAIVLNALSITNLNGHQLGKKMNAIGWKGIFPILYRISNWATFPWGMVHILRSYQLKAQWKKFANPTELVRELQNNQIPIVIIGKWRPLWSHYLIFVAYEINRGWGFIDPGHPRKEIIWKTHNEFSRLWKNYGKSYILINPSNPMSPDSDQNP